MTTPAAPQPPTDPGAGLPGLGPYVSAIPVRPATLSDALASEWTKIRSVRSTLWTLGVMVALLLVVGVLAAIAVTAYSDQPPGTDEVLELGFFGVLLSSICVITLGVLTVTSEFGTGMIRTTLTACPSRGRVLAAKSCVFFLMVFTVTAVTTTVVAMLQTALMGGRAADGAEWARATLGVGLYLALLGLASLALGAVVRHSAGAITIVIALVLLPLVMAMFMFSDRLTDVRTALFAYSVPSQIASLYDASVGVSGPSGWQAVGIMAAVAAVALGAAFFVMDRRDV
ncbi:ABC transporter permease [uncultured Streptomyces sp.]|uniref:ABC transporter permease n=1 Tax=uncultured Streptomyces sp. TaxID=174707 RepID=UPI00260FA63A|nr:ABC transporter permease [uncultured Streptomyces sp.]